MNKKIINHFQKSEQLSVRKPDYQRILDELFLFFVRNDHVGEDRTVQAFLPRAVLNGSKTGVISAKEACIVAGVEEVMYLAKKHTKLTPKQFVPDGQNIIAGTKIISLTGTAKDCLAYERVFVNILQRMSGIATETSKYIEKVHDSQLRQGSAGQVRLKNYPVIAATRKTPWMHLDKKAVAVGGGVTHRLDLSDGILLKDNHLELLQQEFPLKTEADAIVYAIEQVNIVDQNIAIEVEVKSEEAALAAVEAFQKRKLKNPFIILLDNFTSERAKKIIQEFRHSGEGTKGDRLQNQVNRRTDSGQARMTGRNIFFEASGGINLENVTDFAKTGVDIISIGSLTHSPKATDLSMDIISQ